MTEPSQTPSPTGAHPGRRHVRRISPALIGGALLTLLVLGAALFAPLLAPYSPTEQHLGDGLLPPSPEHWMGTDQLGRDIFSRVLYAARTDLRIAVLAALAPFVIGMTVGLLTGYFGGLLRGAVGWVSARITDTVIAFPFYVLVIAIVFAVGAGEAGIILTFALVGWVGYARVLGAMTAALRDAEWVRAARGGGLSHARVLFRHVLPNILPQAIVLLATEIVLIMVAIVTLGYLGLGIQPPTPDWGTMIADGQLFIQSHWWLSAMPGLAVVITGIAFSMLGDGVGDLLRIGHDPARARRGRGRRVHAPGLDAVPGAVTVTGLRIENRQGGALVDGLDLAVAPGAALGIVGESGSGKSLSLRALLGMMPPGTRVAAGDVRVGGRVGMVFQDPLTALDPLTRVGVQVREAVRAAGGRRGSEVLTSPGARVLDLLRDVGLSDPERIARAYPHQLSGGQRQRVVIAMALAGDPDVLLCDEPTTALDVTVQRQVLELLSRLRQERGLTLVFVSHDLAVVAEVCERVLVLRGGRVIETGATADVVRRPSAEYTRDLLDALPALPALAPRTSAGAARSDSVYSDAVSSDAVSSGAVASDVVNSDPLLTVEDLKVRYGRAVAVRGASLVVPRGGALGIVGESGSGKTTLARAIVGQLPAHGGQILLDGAPLPRMRGRALRRAVQLIPQDPYSSLNPRMTVRQTLAELTDTSRVEELLTLVRLDPALAAAYPFELSGGQRQRVAIARALAVSSRVLIADEPTSALDVSVQAEIIELLQSLRRELGLALVFVSHDLAVVHALCDRVAVMRDGEIVEHGGPDFFARPTHDYSRQLLAAVPRLERDPSTP